MKSFCMTPLHVGHSHLPRPLLYPSLCASLCQAGAASLCFLAPSQKSPCNWRTLVSISSPHNCRRAIIKLLKSRLKRTAFGSKEAHHQLLKGCLEAVIAAYDDPDGHADTVLVHHAKTPASARHKAFLLAKRSNTNPGLHSFSRVTVL